MMSKIILASASPRRKQLLEWADVDFQVKSVSTEERCPANLSPERQTIYIAKNKALAVNKLYHNECEHAIIAADTIVVLNGQKIGKPKDRDMAIATLQALSGKKHNVVTGVYIMSAGKEVAFAETTEVEFYPLTVDQIDYYVDKYEPYDKAGAYAIQEWIGVTGVKAIRGDFYNVMGLPVSRVVSALQDLKIL